MPEGNDLLPAVEAATVADAGASAEDLRYASITGIDAILDSWLARRHLSAGQLRLLAAQRDFWRGAQPETLRALKECYDRQPVGAAGG